MTLDGSNFFASMGFMESWRVWAFHLRLDSAKSYKCSLAFWCKFPYVMALGVTAEKKDVACCRKVFEGGNDAEVFHVRILLKRRRVAGVLSQSIKRAE